MADLDDTAEWVDPITGVNNGAAVDASETNVAPEQLAKRTKFLRDQIDALGEVVEDGFEGVPGVSDENPQVQLVVTAFFSNTSDVWSLSMGSPRQVDSSQVGPAVARVVMPAIKGTITKFSAWLAGAASSGLRTGVPDPTVTLVRVDPSDGTTATVATLLDGAGGSTGFATTAGLYEALHQLSTTDVADNTIGPQYQYQLVFNGETGAHARDGLRVTGVSVEISPP